MITIINKQRGCCGDSSTSEKCYKPCAHTHDDRYYSKVIIDRLLSQIEVESGGSTLYFEPEVPDVNLGVNGDVCFVQSEESVYQKENGDWIFKFSFAHIVLWEDIQGDQSTVYLEGFNNNTFIESEVPEWSSQF